MDTRKFGKITVETTHEEKILFPPRITKEELLDYYQDIAPIILPHIKNRLVTLLRYPSGISDEGFYQKNTPDYFPSWIKTHAVKKGEGGTVNYVVCNNAATLVYLANQGTITPHIWLSRLPKLNYPDRMIIDLDPTKKDFTIVRHTALELKVLFEDLGLTPFVMLTGSRGIHVVVPLKKTETFDVVREFAHDVALLLASRNPKTLTCELRKEKRKGRLFIDWLRNAWGATGAAPYSVRPHPGAPVATPITWQELARTKTSQKYTIKTVFKRLAKSGDAWKDINKHAKSLKRARKKLDMLITASK